MKILLAPLLAVLLSLNLSGTAFAEKADRNKPMNVESDALRYDDLNQTSIFTGNVVLTKGTIIIRGARVDVRQDPEGYQYGIVTAEPGKLAYYRQKREGVDQFMEGEGERIEYDGKADIVRFIRKAVMRRFQGATLNDEVTGNLIIYNNTTDVFTVNSEPAGVAAAPAAGGRVRALLSPRNSASAPAAPAGSAGAASSPQSVSGQSSTIAPDGSGLRPSTTMSEDKK